MLAMEQAMAVLQTKQQSDNLNIEDGGTVLGAGQQLAAAVDGDYLTDVVDKADIAAKMAQEKHDKEVAKALEAAKEANIAAEAHA